MFATVNRSTSVAVLTSIAASRGLRVRARPYMVRGVVSALDITTPVSPVAPVAASRNDIDSLLDQLTREAENAQPETITDPSEYGRAYAESESAAAHELSLYA